MAKNLRIPLFLMLMSILVISIFQVYWLRKNYLEEKHLFGAHTNLLFRETIMRLQASKLHLDSNINIRMEDKEGIVNMSTALQEDINDTPGPRKKMRTSMIITMDHGTPATDTNLQFRFRKNGQAAPVFKFLMRVDSLRDSITVKEIVSQYAAALAKENMRPAFSVSVTDTGAARLSTGSADSKMSVGFTKPRVYYLHFANTRWYIIQHLWQPILVSFLLVGITIASFLLMYKNLIRQQRLTQFKNDFISNITHELKTPIATVNVAIEALKNFNALQDPQRTREYLDISANEMQRLGLLVDKVLKLSMYEKKEISLNKEPFNLVDMVREVIASMQLQFDKLGADLTVETSGHNFIIEGDRLHLSSVLYNLLDNALKYSNGKPVVAVQVIDHTQFIEVAVTDQGIGIAPEYKWKIFEQFFRVPGGNRHNTKGYGLGLSYVNHIVRRHMGFIEVNSKPGEGSCFSVKLPFKEAPVVHYGNNRQVRKIAFKIGRS